jgi:hypothetical protein
VKPNAALLTTLLAALACLPAHGDAYLSFGRVVDAETRQPIAGAIVMETVSGKTVITGANGAFAVTGDSTAIIIVKAGYLGQEIDTFRWALQALPPATDPPAGIGPWHGGDHEVPLAPWPARPSLRERH